MKKRNQLLIFALFLLFLNCQVASAASKSLEKYVLNTSMTDKPLTSFASNTKTALNLVREKYPEDTYIKIGENAQVRYYSALGIKRVFFFLEEGAQLTFSPFYNLLYLEDHSPHTELSNIHFILSKNSSVNIYRIRLKDSTTFHSLDGGNVYLESCFGYVKFINDDFQAVELRNFHGNVFTEGMSEKYFGKNVKITGEATMLEELPSLSDKITEFTFGNEEREKGLDKKTYKQRLLEFERLLEEEKSKQ